MLEDGWLRFLGWLGFATSVKPLDQDAQRSHRTASCRDDSREGNWPAVVSPLLALSGVVVLFVPSRCWPAPSLLLFLLAAVFAVVGRKRAKRTGAPFRRLAATGLALVLLAVAFLVIGFFVLFYAFTHGGPPVN
jgi:hypothetical protein